MYTKEKSIDIISTINGLMHMCHQIATDHGFHEDHKKVREIIEDNARITLHEKVHLRTWFEATTEQAEIARMHSELSEWLEGIRKDPDMLDNHLPHFTAGVVEAADTIIRIFDTCAKRGYPLAQALLAKMEFNNSRPHKHGKNS